jgi:hypothetical protein
LKGRNYTTAPVIAHPRCSSRPAFPSSSGSRAMLLMLDITPAREAEPAISGDLE